jgi:2-methylcitrate dehydratase PrpD
MDRRTKLTRRNLAHVAALGVGAGLALKKAAAFEAEGLTRRMADFVVSTKFSDLPLNLIETGRKSILDGIGLALVGSVSKSGPLIRAYIQSLGISKTEATLIGTSMKSAVSFAALANGIGIHAEDYDDTQLSSAPDRVYGLLTHPTAPALSAALAVAESKGVAGRDLVLAYHLGVEVECKIAEAISPRHYQDGFHSTGTCGTFGSVVAAMKLRGADAATLARAIGIAASESAGLRENFGTMTKPFHAGRAAESGIIAADMAQLGWTASSQILEAPSGFFHAAGGGYDAGALTFAKPWTFLSPGVSIKPFPSGSLTHPGMTALQKLIRDNDVKPDQVERLDVGTNRNMPTALIHHKPTDSLQGKFSMEFCMSSLLLYRRAGLNEFTDEVVNRPEVKAMIARINFGVNEIAEKAGYDKMTTILDLHLRDGRTLSTRADFAKGSPEDPMSFEEVKTKFDDCARFAKWPAAKTKAIMAMVEKLEDLPDIRKLTQLLQA